MKGIEKYDSTENTFPSGERESFPSGERERGEGDSDL